MTYIILNVIMRATVDDFVEYDIPFQSKGKNQFMHFIIAIFAAYSSPFSTSLFRSALAKYFVNDVICRPRYFSCRFGM